MDSKYSGSIILHGQFLFLLVLFGVTSITVQEAEYKLHVADLTIRLINMKILANKDGLTDDDLTYKFANVTALFRSIDNLSGMSSWIKWYVDGGWDIPKEYEQKFKELNKLVMELRVLMELDLFLEQIQGKYRLKLFSNSNRIQSFDLDNGQKLLSTRIQEYTSRLEKIQTIMNKSEERCKVLRNQTKTSEVSTKNMLRAHCIMLTLVRFDSCNQ